VKNSYYIVIVIFLLVNTPSISQTSDLVDILAEKVVSAESRAFGTVNIMIKEGYHIQSNKVDDEYIIPTKLDVIDNEFIQLIEIVYPEGKDFNLVGSDMILNVFDGEFEIKIKLRIDSQDVLGEYQLDAILHYQACDDKSCFAPKSIEFVIPVEIIK